MMPSAASGPVVGPQVGQRGRQAGLDAVDRQRFHDHAGGERQHLLGATAQQRASAAQVLRARARPSAPVPALALPVLMTSARMPCPRPGARGTPAPARRRSGSA
jgi:hypothetical protein